MEKLPHIDATTNETDYGPEARKQLEVGTILNIRRTCGRVHQASISSINYNKMSTNVEWYENGEVKGKEVDLVMLQMLNPKLVIKLPSGNPDVQVPKVIINNFREAINVPSANAPNGSVTSRRDTVAVFNSVAKSSPLRQSNHANTMVKERQSRRGRRTTCTEEHIRHVSNTASSKNPYQALGGMISEYRRNLVIKPLTDRDYTESHPITVCVRKRPLNKMEIANHEIDIITVPTSNQLIVHEPKNKIDLRKYMENILFRFDYAFNEDADNKLVYRFTAQPLIKSIFRGGFATCFAYGQTGSGKSHTMSGSCEEDNPKNNNGIYSLATKDVFQFINSEKFSHLKLTVSASYFEIYSGKVFDLLANKSKLRVLEDGKQQVQVVGLSEKTVKSPDEVINLIATGNLARKSGQTAANAYSSRSHAVFQLILKSGLDKHNVHGKLSLIDLAGSERGADTSSTDRQTRMEGAEINKSLLALKECIRALGRKKSHLPFRMSKLTQILKDSFVGQNSRTCMIAMISPGIRSCEHSLNTLRYANRVKELSATEMYRNIMPPDVKNADSNDDHVVHQLSELETNEEMLKIHRIISELQLAEDKMIENHKHAVKQLQQFAKKGKTLLRMADVVDFNQEQYCDEWDNLLFNLINTLTESKDAVLDYKNKLADEEKLSRRK